MALFVSKLSHCLYDLLSRCQSGEWKVEVPLVISNHPNLESVAQRFGIPYHVLPVTAENKQEQERQALALLRSHRVDLARYMQILTGEFITHYPDRIINIHHSFLPAFPGARPYHSAHERGVKVIGATSHYVTTNLDRGPDHRTGRREGQSRGRCRGPGTQGAGPREDRSVSGCLVSHPTDGPRVRQPNGSVCLTTQKPSILVLGGQHRNALGIVRHLGRLGIPVLVGGDSRFARSNYSRYAQRRFTYPPGREMKSRTAATLDDARGGLEATHREILARVREWHPDIVLPMMDDSWRLVYAFQDEYAQLTRVVPCPGRGIFEQMLNKRTMTERAQQCGVATPWTLCPESQEAALDARDQPPTPSCRNHLRASPVRASAAWKAQRTSLKPSNTSARRR